VDSALSPRLARFLARARAQVDRELDRLLPDPKTPPRRLHTAMRYAVLPGGKRLRPALTLLAHAAVSGNGGSRGLAMRAACAVELVHCFSLVHDDLPCLDDSPARRGRPSLHQRFDEATALLAGDALLALAFEVLASTPAGRSRAAALGIAGELARASGAAGMIGGQAAELDLAGRTPSLAALRWVHRRKTGRLFEAAAVAGGLAGGGTPRLQTTLRRYARALGLAFQIADDLLDSSSTRKDPDTYPGLLGVDRAASALDQAREAARREACRLKPPERELCADLADFAAARQS
jgi:geranylgeranyl pyrophosphate synthase